MFSTGRQRENVNIRDDGFDLGGTLRAGFAVALGVRTNMSSNSVRRRQLATRDIDEIARLAAEVFARKGYHGTSVTNLCEALGFQRGTLYYRIGSKERLAVEIHTRFIEPFIERLRSATANASSPADALNAFSREMMRTIAKDQALVKVFFDEFRPGSEKRWAQVETKRDRVVHLLESILAEGRSRGLFIVSDIEIAALGFLGMHNWAVRWYEPEGRLTPDEISAIFVEIFLRGIANAAAAGSC